jgi:hypothetical protein
LAAVLFLALGVLGMLSHPAAALGQEGAVLTGVWYWENIIPVFPGAVLPSILTFHNNGTCVCSDALAFGGLPTNTNRYIPFQGVWERIGPHKFRAMWLVLRFDAATGALLGVGRSRATFAFSTDFDHFEGSMHLDFLPCPAGPFGFLMCPNPLLAQEGDWQPWSATGSDFSFKAARVSVVPY